MKSAMPFHGVDVTTLRAICKAVFAAHPVTGAAAWRRDVLAIWRGAKFREERYAAIGLTGDRRARTFQTMASLPMYEEMIVTGAWWDFVDTLASKRLGEILRNEPAPMRKAMRAWSRGEDMWKRRSAILCQITFKKDTDLDLLFALHRALDRLEGVLPEEGDRLGAPVIRVDGREADRDVRREEPRAPFAASRSARR